MHGDEIRQIVLRRRRRYRRWIVGFQVFCILCALFFLAAFVFLPRSSDSSLVEAILLSIGIAVGTVFVYSILAASVSADVATTDRQLSDIEQGVFLADWTDQADGNGAFIGYCGLVFDGQYTPWQGAWDFSLSKVVFENRTCRMTFHFALESRAGVKRIKSIDISVPKTQSFEGRRIAKKFENAIGGSGNFEATLRHSQPDS